MSAAPRMSAAGGVHTLRRVIVYGLLFIMVILATIGVSGILTRLIGDTPEFLFGFDSGLALDLAYALIAGPFAILLWWFAWRGLTASGDRHSVLWPVYLTLTYTVALIAATVNILGTLSALVWGEWKPHSLATGLTWAAVAAAHHWMLRHPAKSPTRLVGVAAMLGWWFGIAVAAGALATAFTEVFDSALDAFAGVTRLGLDWWLDPLAALVWFAGGLALWVWHDRVHRIPSLHTVFSEVVRVIIVGVGAVSLMLGGSIIVLRAVLRLAFDQSEPTARMLEGLPEAIAAVLVGVLVWVVLRRTIPSTTSGPAIAVRLATSIVALAAAASGVGVVLNALLATQAAHVGSSSAIPLLLGGVSALLVGGVVWFLVWRPLATDAATSTLLAARRVYLVVVFGVSALVALVTLIFIGFRLFALLLGDTGGLSLLEDIRAPLGLITATVLVAVYHFVLWRRDRELVQPGADARRIERITIVATPAPGIEALLDAVRDATGARVQWWPRADAHDAPTLDGVVAALDGIAAERVLVVTSSGRVEAIPLAD